MINTTACILRPPLSKGTHKHTLKATSCPVHSTRTPAEHAGSLALKKSDQKQAVTQTQAATSTSLPPAPSQQIHMQRNTQTHCHIHFNTFLSQEFLPKTNIGVKMAGWKPY